MTISHGSMPPRAPVRQAPHTSQTYSASWTSVNKREEPSTCTLPSISNLLNVADGASTPVLSSPKGHARPTAPTYELTRRAKPQAHYATSPSRTHLDASHMTPVSRPGSSHAQGLPPTPPMSQAASIDGHSPRDEDLHQFPPASRPGPYSHETTPPLESESRHHYLSASYRRSPDSHFSELSQQHPHSQAFPSAHPSTSPHVSRDSPPSPYGSNLWQHHHYLNPSQGAGYQQNPERYICPTCNKAFSRPSSLRIHSHSHTGEKPYKCAHTGCGKAFSVRSNMKRHERGCHSFEVTASPRFAL